MANEWSRTITSDIRAERAEVIRRMKKAAAWLKPEEWRLFLDVHDLLFAHREKMDLLRIDMSPEQLKTFQPSITRVMYALHELAKAGCLWSSFGRILDKELGYPHRSKRRS